MNIEIYDVEKALELDDVPMCPLCDRPAKASEELAIGVVRNEAILIHADCGEDAEELDDDD